MNKDWLDINILEDYLDGKLDAKTMNRVEREALDDPFVAEALAGLSESPKRSLNNLSLLQKQLQERVAEEQVAKKGRVITWQRLSIAATAAVLFIAVSIIFWMKDTANRKQETAGRAKQVEVNIAPVTGQDTLDVSPSDPVLAKVSPKAPVVVSPSADAAVNEAVMAMRENAYAANLKNNEVRAAGDSSAVVTTLSEVAIQDAVSPLKHEAVAAATTVMATPQASALLKSSLKGRVLDEKTGEPLQGAVIMLDGKTDGTVTNKEGEFELRSPELLASSKVVASYIGYKNQDVKVALDGPVLVRMAPDSHALNEVVTVAYGSAKKAKAGEKDTAVVGALAGRVAGVSVSKAAKARKTKVDMISNPVGGWDNWESYLDKNNTYKQDKGQSAQVGLTFTVDHTGKPSDVTVLTSANEKYDAEAKRLLLNGPKWSQPKVKGSRMTVYITF